MKCTVNLKVTTRSYVVAEPHEVSAGNSKSAEAIAAAEAINSHGRDNITEITVISVSEVRANA